ncbi:recombinase family protein [Streptomyces sp. NPDC102441]|uniref:recombinase family protein n=1 Tax=Streptomyces sp. NPDC102441 TaxID=3366176 RepID=UPI0038198576
MRAVSYGRQSKQREDESRTSPEGQRKATRDLIDARGWTFAGHFEDVGRSGFDPKIVRPGFEALMAAVRAHECDVVVIPALSRLTRQGAYEAMKINDELSRHGVSLVSVDEPFLDTSNPIGVAIFALIAGLAQQESESKRQHILRAQAAIRQVGGHVTGSAPYGFISERVTVPVPGQEGTLTVTRLVPDPVTVGHVRSMVDDAMSGLAANAIAKRLNAEGVPTSHGADPATKWHTASVYRVLRDPRLAGFASKVADQRREPQRDAAGEILRTHVGIVTPGEWFALQEIVSGKRPETRKHAGTPALLSGWQFLFCAQCGGPMQAGVGRGLRYYRCTRPANASAEHTLSSVRMPNLDDMVVRRTFARLTAIAGTDFGDLSEADQSLWVEASRRFAHQEDRSGIETQRAEMSAALEYNRAALVTLYQDREQGAYMGSTGTKIFRDSAERLAAEESRLEAALADLDGASLASISLPVEAWVSANGDPLGEDAPWHSWDLTTRREFLALFIDRIDVGKPTAYGRASKVEDRLAITWAGGEA